jgi:hypothetical protein
MYMLYLDTLLITHRSSTLLFPVFLTPLMHAPVLPVGQRSVGTVAVSALCHVENCEFVHLETSRGSPHDLGPSGDLMS